MSAAQDRFDNLLSDLANEPARTHGKLVLEFAAWVWDEAWDVRDAQARREARSGLLQYRDLNPFVVR